MLTYKTPKNVTAYDAVPIWYELKLKRDIIKNKYMHVSATAGEDAERENGNVYFYMNLPGKIDVTYKYEGYVSGKLNEAERPNLSLNFRSDKIADSFPECDASDLIYSETVQSTYYTWMKFTYTNTGNTVLDSNGNGAFAFYPILYKKSNTGELTQVSDTPNGYIRLDDEVYPGESGTLWINYSKRNLKPGTYVLKLNGYSRYENDDPDNWNRTLFGGDTVTLSTFEFTVASNNVVTTPKEVKKEVPPVSSITRNSWLHTYEEFLSSFNTHLRGTRGATISDVIYVLPPGPTKSYSN